MTWQLQLKSDLIRAGTVGIPKAALVQRFRHVVKADALDDWLEHWRSSGKVQKFTKPNRGRPQTIWRATTLMLEDIPKPEGNRRAKKKDDD